MDPIQLSNEEQALLEAHPMTSAGNPATIDGALQAELLDGDGSVGDADPANPNRVVLRSGTASDDGAGGPAISRFRVFADADPTSGVVMIEEVVELHVRPPNAANLGLVSVEIQPKPAA